MRTLTVAFSKSLQGDLHLPGDKSISHRVVMLGSIARGETRAKNFLASADCLATVDCFRKLGIEIQTAGNKIVIQGKGLNGLRPSRETLEAGNSATTLRLLSGILAGQNFETRINGDASIQRRPMGRIAQPLRLMGANVEGRRVGEEIFAPLKIYGGNLKAIEYELPVASAQVKSAILLAGLFAKGETRVIEKNPSRDHSERLLAHFGAKIKRSGLETAVKGQEEFNGAEVDIPADISSAAFFIVAGGLTENSALRIFNVGVNPTRMGIIEVLHRMGANLEVGDEKIISEETRATIFVKSSKLKAIKVSGEIIPRIIDEIPILAVAATQAEGTTEIRGAQELRVKESDRIATVVSELRKLGAKVEELDDGLIISGPTKLKGARVNSYGDHRLAMAMAIAGLVAQGQTMVENTDCIETSFPGFEAILASLVK
jgi:3-phosphoshikimate 1-carboxyvinyltransferase